MFRQYNPSKFNNSQKEITPLKEFNDDSNNISMRKEENSHSNSNEPLVYVHYLLKNQNKYSFIYKYK